MKRRSALEKLLDGWEKHPERLDIGSEISINKNKFSLLLDEIKKRRPKYIVIGEEHKCNESFYLIRALLKARIAGSLYLEGFDIGELTERRRSKTTLKRVTKLLHPEKWYKLAVLAEKKGLKVYGLDSHPSENSEDLMTYRTKWATEYLNRAKDTPALVLVGLTHIGVDDFSRYDKGVNIISALMQKGVKGTDILTIAAYDLPHGKESWKSTYKSKDGPSKDVEVKTGDLLKVSDALGLIGSESLKKDYEFSDYVIFYGNSSVKNLIGDLCYMSHYLGKKSSEQ